MTFEDDWLAIPAHLRPGLARYLVLGVTPGSFLTAVICNDLEGAVFAASPVSLPALPDLVRFLRWHVSPLAYGSREAMNRWTPIASDGLPTVCTLHMIPEDERVIRAACDLEFAHAS